MGEFTVHRVRFFHYMPSAVRALAFQPQRQKIAVARTDGSLEILNRADHLFQEKVIPGREQRGTEALAWAGQRLFSAGLNGELVEYDMQELREKYRLDASGGPVWTLTCNPQGTRLAVGCEDGTVKLFEVCDDGIQFERNLAKQKGRILSLSWHPSGSRLVAGMAGVIWVFDAGTGQSVHRLLVERGTGAPRSKECVVWSVVCLSDGTIVSGDSSGNVKVWDGDTGTLIRNHQVTKWDVLALSVSQDETSLVAGTSEGTVVQFQHLSVVLGREDKEWVQTRTFKNHTHDVRAVLELDTAVVSGGMDTQLVVRPLLDKIDVKTSASALRKIHFPHRRLVSCSRTARLLLFQHRIHLELWRLGESEGTGDSLPIKRKPEKLLHLKTKGEEHICCSALSPCGGWVVVSTVTNLRLYRLQCDETISITKVSKLPKVVSSANQICFSSDSSYLFTASTCSSVHVLALSQSGCTFVCTLKPKSCKRTYNWPEFLVSASRTVGHCVLDLVIVCVQAYCTVPVYSSGVTAMSINPATNNLFMVHADQQIFEFSLEQKQYTDWSRLVHRKGLHPQWLERDTPVTNVTFSPRNPAHVILHDMYMFCIIDQTLPLPERNSQLVNQLTLRSLPEKERRAHSHAFKICKTFKELLFVELLEDQSLVVIERPLLDITAQLPPPVRQKKFAT
uniref:Anaphase-promoting complex subunit 4 WD40 domain-containing protein n=1 Tax=Electrophorus electricus TaxID=8005 RepID=A0A4W4G369_ELEEL